MREKITLICLSLSTILFSIATFINRNTVSELMASNAHLSQRNDYLVNTYIEHIKHDLEVNYALQAQLHTDQWNWRQDWKTFEIKKTQLGEDSELVSELEQLNLRKEELDSKEKEYIARSVQLNTEWSQFVSKRE